MACGAAAIEPTRRRGVAQSSNRHSEEPMASSKSKKAKLIGKTKQLIGEVTGDGKLVEEGKQQEKAEQGKDDQDRGGPFQKLNQLT